MKQLFKGLNAFEASEYVLFALAAATLPWSWSLSLKMLFLLLLNTVIKCVRSRSCGNKRLGKAERITLIAMIVFPAVYALSVLWSDNRVEGWRNVTAKLTFAEFAIIALLSDTSYLKQKHIHSIMQLFTASILVRFVVRLGITLFDFLFNNRPHDELLGFYFDPMHHSYMSMYVLLALSYCCYLLYKAKHWNQARYIAVVVAAVILCAYIVILKSRAALLCLVLMVAAAWCVLVFVKRHYRQGIIILGLCVIGCVTAMVAMPSKQKRLTNSIISIASGHRDEDRFTITRAALNITSLNMPWGVGAGDRIDEMDKQYTQMGAAAEKEHLFNPHNQYLDTLMTTGVLGLLVLVVMLAIPMTKAIKQRDWILTAMFFIVIFNALFESIFERQMGIIFFCLMFCILQNRQKGCIIDTER